MPTIPFWKPGNTWYIYHTDADATPEMQRAAQLAAKHKDTPAVVHLDSLGREVLAVAHNRCPGEHGPWEDKKYLTYTRLDTEGKALWIQDARGNVVMRYTLPAVAGADPLQDFCPAYDLAGNLLYQHSMDAGDRWMLPDTAGQALYSWDVNERWENGEAMEERRIYHNTYDELRRPKDQYLRISDGPWQLIEQTIYGEKCPDDADDKNLRGQIWQHYDPSGLIINLRFDFRGNLLEQSRQLARKFEASVIDWSPDSTTAALESEVFTQCTEYDALNRMTRQYNWHRNEGARRVAVYEPKYNERGLLAGEDLILGAKKEENGYSGGSKTTAIFGLTYDPKGQKQCIRYGNGTTTRYTYDTKNFRLIQLRTTRSIQEEDAILKDSTIAQDLYYTYDPSGNITEISDEAIKTKFYNNQEINASSLYEYDAQYQLISATGRENNALDNKAPGPKPEDAVPIGELVLRDYTQYCTYDSVGNILRMRHKAGLRKLEERWTRYYHYAKHSNRLLAPQVGDPGAYELYPDKPTLEVKYHYDTHGSMLNFSNVGDKNLPVGTTAI
ncbi:MAG: hypothetical protein IPN33_23105 [Saprospiraceae bacterium]|nr:hypothetical protein [Saprospiraceae bacterium]